VTVFAEAVIALQTPRLRLRAHVPTDHAACSALWADPAVVEQIGGKAFSPEEVWSRMLRYAGLWRWFGFGYWVIESRAGDFLGEVGFADFRRAVEPPLGAAPELGFALMPAAQGQGIATEAATAALSWLDATAAHPRTVCLINAAHHRSLRVAEKLGYGNATPAAYRGQPVLVLERPAPPQRAR
jgi:RimJ/RimL family protein N-acetyltransferase